MACFSTLQECELQLADCAEGVSETFSDVEELAMHRRFSDCHHESEPGCKIRAAIESGEPSEKTISLTIKATERASKKRRFGRATRDTQAAFKMYRNVQSESRNIKKGSASWVPDKGIPEQSLNTEL